MDKIKKSNFCVRRYRNNSMTCIPGSPGFSAPVMAVILTGFANAGQSIPKPEVAEPKRSVYPAALPPTLMIEVPQGSLLKMSLESLHKPTPFA